ncbi:MAG: hypothetical protein K9H84_06070 [Bacteroidales bacterium]|nr:hypothetical protein [Bacteroidales bacterium]
MVKKLLILFSIGIITILSCDKANDLLKFDIEHSTSFEIQSSITPFDPPFPVPTPDITTNSEQKFENNNTKASLVKDVKLKELELDISDPPEKTFSFLKEVYIYISTDSTDEIMAASKTNIPKDAQQISLETTDKSLDKYLKSKTYNLRTEVVTREVLNQDITVDADLVFQVTADPL